MINVKKFFETPKKAILSTVCIAAALTVLDGGSVLATNIAAKSSAMTTAFRYMILSFIRQTRATITRLTPLPELFGKRVQKASRALRERMQAFKIPVPILTRTQQNPLP